MRTSEINEKIFPSFWLDELLEVTLNSAKTNLKTLSAQTLKEIEMKLPVEIDRVSTCTKEQAFSLYCNEQLKVVVGQYDQALRLLQQRQTPTCSNSQIRTTAPAQLVDTTGAE